MERIVLSMLFLPQVVFAVPAPSADAMKRQMMQVSRMQNERMRGEVRDQVQMLNARKRQLNADLQKIGLGTEQKTKLIAELRKVEDELAERTTQFKKMSEE